MGKEFIALEHHAHLLAYRIPAQIPPEHPNPGHADLAPLDGLQPVDAAQQRALAAARRAENHHHLATMQREVDVVQRHRLAIALVQAADLQQRRLHGARTGLRLRSVPGMRALARKCCTRFRKCAITGTRAGFMAGGGV